RFGNSPGYRTGRSLASSGFFTYFANFESSIGSTAFHSSLSPIGVMTSLKSGLPRRETCVHGPDFILLCLSWTYTLRRLAPAQMPRTETAFAGSLGTEPSFVSMWIGTLIAIAWTFIVFSGSTLSPVGLGI